MMAIIMAIEDDDDREFVEKIFDRYEKNMYFTAYDILRNRADAEDCVQDTFVKIIDKLDCFKKAHEEGNLAKLVALVCRNTALDRYKGNKRRARDSILKRCTMRTASRRWRTSPTARQTWSGS